MCTSHLSHERSYSPFTRQPTLTPTFFWYNLLFSMAVFNPRLMPMLAMRNVVLWNVSDWWFWRPDIPRTVADPEGQGGGGGRHRSGGQRTPVLASDFYDLAPPPPIQKSWIRQWTYASTGATPAPFPESSVFCMTCRATGCIWFLRPATHSLTHSLTHYHSLYVLSLSSLSSTRTFSISIFEYLNILCLNAWIMHFASLFKSNS